MKKALTPIYFSDDAITVAIIHYNTPDLTHACIGSLIVNGGLGGRLRLVVFDNSDTKPFCAAPGVEVIDNTKGQIIDFDAELAKYPDRDRSIGCAKGCEFGSVKHMMTVQKLWELLPQGFILMESDIMITRPITEFVRRDYSFVGYAQKAQPGNPFQIGRVLPMLCWMNVPLLTKYGARYYDPTRTYGLLPGGRENRNNWYDTGAVMLEDILKHRPHLKGLHLDIRPYVVHYGSASWKSNDEQAHMAWVESMRHIFPSEDKMQEAVSEWEEGWRGDMPPHLSGVAVCAIGRMENRYAVEWVEHYKRLGVAKIIIYDNNRKDDGETFADVLQPYIDSGLVTIIPYEGFQNPCYTECYKRFGDQYKWIGFLDFDEYVNFDDPDMMLPAFLDDCEGDCLQLNWRIMTDSGLTHYDPRPLQERFTEARELDFSIHHHVKSFVRGGQKGVLFLDPHSPAEPKMMCVNAEGRQVEQKSLVSTVTHHPARIDHFNTKTAEEWVSIKMKRLFPIDGDYNANAVKNNIEYFFAINERTPEKESILGVESHAGTVIVCAPSKPSKPRTRKSTNRKGK